jgi:hypothetical protein
VRKTLSSILVAAVLLFVGCDNEIALTLGDNKAKTDSITVYIIPAGSHYAKQSAYRPLSATRIRFKARFNKSAIYQTAEKGNQEDINKLYGMSDCDSNHQMNSARFGWRWYNNALEIWAYTYANSARKLAYIGSVPLNAYASYEIAFTNTTYIFQVNGSTVSLPRHCRLEAKGYKLYPYFGGDETAPHEITIDIEDVQ